MDKKQYYRLLGVREGASIDEIEKAYKENLRKLSLPDYADDPEYVQRKKARLKNAYQVVTGNAAPASPQQKEAFFEKMKDVMEEGGGLNEITDMLAKKSARSLERNSVRSRSGKRYAGKQAKGLPSFVGICVTIFVISSLISGILGILGEAEYSYEEEMIPHNQGEWVSVYDDDYIWENPYSTRVACMTVNGDEFDYYDRIDFSERYGDKVEHQEDWEFEEALSESLERLSHDVLDYENHRELAGYITGEWEYFLEEASESECADVILTWAWAPDYEDIAGYKETYTDEVIVTYDQYIHYICDVITEQADRVFGEEL